MEEIVYRQLMAHLEHNSLLFEYQFGFRQNHSTEVALTYFNDLIRVEADRGMATGGVFIDLTKEFDNISHSVNCPLMAYMTWNYIDLLTIYSFTSR